MFPQFACTPAVFVWNFHESHDRVFSFLQIGLEALFDVACAFIRVNFQDLVRISHVGCVQATSQQFCSEQGVFPQAELIS